jgi:hypothetical protein
MPQGFADVFLPERGGIAPPLDFGQRGVSRPVSMGGSKLQEEAS